MLIKVHIGVVGLLNVRVVQDAKVVAARGLQAVVTEDLFDVAHGTALAEEEGCRGVPQNVGRYMLFEPGALCYSPEHSLHAV